MKIFPIGPLPEDWKCVFHPFQFYSQIELWWHQICQQLTFFKWNCAVFRTNPVQITPRALDWWLFLEPDKSRPSKQCRFLYNPLLGISSTTARRWWWRPASSQHVAFIPRCGKRHVTPLERDYTAFLSSLMSAFADALHPNWLHCSTYVPSITFFLLSPGKWNHPHPHSPWYHHYRKTDPQDIHCRPPVAATSPVVRWKLGVETRVVFRPYILLGSWIIFVYWHRNKK